MLHDVGISALRQVPVAANDAVRRLAADLYCERMEFQLGPPATPTPTPTKVPVRPGKIIGVAR